MKKTNAIISVIVPVYNVKNYIPQCLDSIMTQTFADIEVICVDDGSTDGSGELLDEYASRDTRIRVIHKENTGYGDSMNVGLDQAKGEYIGIVESDDSVLPDFFQILYDAVKKYDLDIVKSECLFCWDSYSYRFRVHNASLERYFGKVLGKDRLWVRCQFLMNIWTGLYRKEMLRRHDIRFHETPGASYQDNGFWMQGMIFAEKMLCLDYAGYLYRQDNETASVKDPQKVYTMIDEYAWLANHLQGKVSSREMDVINAFRLIRGYWSFYRIGDEFKREFCDRFIADYERYGDVFFRDIAMQDLLVPVVEDPDTFCNMVREKKRYVYKCLNDADSVIIYGAGNRGQRLYRMLINHRLADKLRCFVESKPPCTDMIGKHRVLCVDDLEVDLQGAAVIISAANGSGIYCEMKESIEKYDPGYVLDSEMLFDNFYNLA